ncbi:hypothetical protein JR316_0002078 [Psilocybe cubensis]|uniref:Uncharacterized protein n=1 Tax=Psilocybe cubensis TaxID=181762 RepID=A0ACB8HCG8_PSICU|nr:hypothetical protein JR316_0002078 [Psilocybe cubensis]KAH9485171.1 hypothetical protein JR316_0002078 [Psilocybe cubensis]
MSTEELTNSVTSILKMKVKCVGGNASRFGRTWCRFKASFLVKVFPHPPLHKYGFSPLCVSRWRFKSCWRLKDNAQRSQGKGLTDEVG